MSWQDIRVVAESVSLAVAAKCEPILRAFSVFVNLYLHGGRANVYYTYLYLCLSD